MSAATITDADEKTKEQFDEAFEATATGEIIEDDSAKACGVTCGGSCCTFSL